MQSIDVINILLGVAGAGMVGTVFVDMVATVLAPESRGPVSLRASRLTWAVVRRASRSSLLPEMFPVGGALVVIASVGAWLLGIWLGFGLMLHAAGGPAATVPAAFTGTGGLARSLYLSGASITSVGFGDLVAESGLGKFMTVAEAAAGLAAVTAAISYVLSIYPLVSRKRMAAVRAADSGADRPGRAASLVLEAGEGWLPRLYEDLAMVNQDLRRFPALYFFHASRREEELTTLLRAGCLAVVHLEWTLAERLPAAHRLYAVPLRRAVVRMMRDLQRDFDIPRGETSTPEEVAEALTSLRRAAEAAVGPPVRGGEPPSDLCDFLAEAERFMHGLARAHGYQHESLDHLPEDSAVAA